MQTSPVPITSLEHQHFLQNILKKTTDTTLNANLPECVGMSYALLLLKFLSELESILPEWTLVSFHAAAQLPKIRKQPVLFRPLASYHQRNILDGETEASNLNLDYAAIIIGQSIAVEYPIAQ